MSASAALRVSHQLGPGSRRRDPARKSRPGAPQLQATTADPDLLEHGEDQVVDVGGAVAHHGSVCTWPTSAWRERRRVAPPAPAVDVSVADSAGSGRGAGARRRSCDVGLARPQRTSMTSPVVSRTVTSRSPVEQLVELGGVVDGPGSPGQRVRGQAPGTAAVRWCRRSPPPGRGLV